jgi:hypothetical protein
VGDNILGMPFGGSLQLFNTATSGDSGQTSGFARGENKVEVSVIDAANTSALLHPSSTDDGPETITSLSTASGGMSVPGADMTYAGGTHLRLFILPMPSMPESSLMFVIYGDPSNFDTLNVIIQSVRFTQAKG